MPSTPEKITVVNIVAFNYSGTTWLNLMLGSHPRAFTVGEMKLIDKLGKPVCAFDPEDCPIWDRYDPNADENPFLQIARITGKDVLVANKNQRYFRYLDHPSIEPRFLHLIRDGRAVTASMLRKERADSVWAAAREWVHDVKRHHRLLRRQRRDQQRRVIYERLVEDTPGQLQDICRFIGIDYDPAMLEYWQKTHHPLGGNRGTLVAMAQRSGVELSDQPPEGPQNTTDAPVWDRDLAHYRNSDPAQFVDERWKRELTPRQLRVFGLVAGRLNRRLGYSGRVDPG